MKKFLIYLPKGSGGGYDFGIELVAKPNSLYNPEEEAKKIIDFLGQLPEEVVRNVLRDPYYRHYIEKIAREPRRK